VELYTVYVNEFVAKSPIVAGCGCKIHCYEHHFVHMVKLSKKDGSRLYFPDEKPIILSTTSGFGCYEHESRRAVRIMASLETLIRPDRVVRAERLKTGDRAFIKEFGCSQYPFIIVMVHRDGDLLALTTGQPTRRRNIRPWLAGTVLFSKTPQPSG